MTSIQIDLKDGLSSSVAIKGPCIVATTANITLSGEQTIDGVAVVTDDRVLVKDQTTGSENGIWICDTGAWRRSKDFNKTKDIKTGTMVNVVGGTVGVGWWQVSTTGDISVGTTSIAFTRSIEVAAGLPFPAVANSFLQRNAGNTAYDAKTSTEVRNALAAAVFVANRAAVKALDPTKDKAATTYGEGRRNGTWIAYLTSSLSAAEQAAAAADTAEGIYLTSGSYTWIRHADWYAKGANAGWFGLIADYDDVAKTGTANQGAINAALAVVDWVTLPTGKMLLSDKVTLNGVKKLTGGSRRSTLVYVNSGYNLAATGVFQFTGGGGRHSLGGFTIVCQDQPSDPNIANYIAYPPLVSAVGISNFEIFNMRMLEAYIGIDMTGNTGASNIDDLEYSFYSKGIKIDGALDSIKLSRLHQWPFGFSADATKQGVMAAGRGIEVGRADDFHLSNSLMYGCRQSVYFFNGTGGAAFGSIVGCDFDNNGGVTFAGPAIIEGSANIFTLGDAGGMMLSMTSGGASFHLSGSRFLNTVINTAGRGIAIDAGSFVASGCSFEAGSGDQSMMRVVNNATAILTGNKFSRTSTVTYTTAMIDVGGTGVTFAATGNFAVPMTTGASPLFAVSNAASGVLDNNYLGTGWSNNIAAGATTLPAPRGVKVDRQITTATSVVALSNSATTAQAIFAAANDTLNLKGNTSYRFRAKLSFDTGATSHTTAFGLGGTATFTSFEYVSSAISGVAGALATPQMCRQASSSATVLTDASTAGSTTIWIEGILRTNAAGTIIPQVTFSAGPTGTCQTNINSFFEVEEFGADTLAAIGNWA